MGILRQMTVPQAPKPPGLVHQEEECRALIAQVPAGVIGARLRRARQRMGLSIRDLAASAHVSKNSIVHLERGGSAQPMTVLKVCEALGIHVVSIAKPEGPNAMAVHRRDDDRWYDLTAFGEGMLGGIDAPLSREERRKLIEAGAKTPLMILTSRLECGRLLPTIIELYQESDTRSHAGEEFVFILRGSAAIRIGAEEVTLREGEAVTFWSAEEHSYAPARGSALPALVLSVRIDDHPGRESRHDEPQ